MVGKHLDQTTDLVEDIAMKIVEASQWQIKPNTREREKLKNYGGYQTLYV